MVTLTSENFKSEILDFQGFAVVIFTASWDATPQENMNVAKPCKCGVIDFDSERELVHRYSVRELPFYFVFLNGHVVYSGNSLQRFRENLTK